MSAATEDAAKPGELLAAVKSDNVDKLAEFLAIGDAAVANSQLSMDLLQAAAQASASRAAGLLLEDELERFSFELPQPLIALVSRFPNLAGWTLLAAAAAGKLDSLEQLLTELTSLEDDPELWRRLSVCLAARHPDQTLHALACGRCPRLLGRLLPESIDTGQSESAVAMSPAEREALEVDLPELLPARVRPLLRLADFSETDSRSLAKKAVETGNAELVRNLLQLGRIRPDHLEMPGIPPPAELVLSGHLELAGELLPLRRRDLLHCCLDLRNVCKGQLKRLPPASSALLSSSKPSSATSLAPAMSPDGLRKLRDFAELVCLNAVDLTYAACPPSCQPLIHHHLLRPPPSGAGASIAKKSPRNLFATRCFVELVDRRWRAGAYPSQLGRRWPNLASPREKFLLHMAAFLVFMALHAFFIVKLDSQWLWVDSMMSVYFISYILQELHELLRMGKRYFNIWNLIDLFQLLFHLLGLAFKAAVVTAAVHVDQVYISRILLGVSFMFCGLKFVLQLRAYRKFGPFINMMKALFWADLLPFLAAMFFFLVVCSGIFFHALLTPGNQVYTASGNVLRVNQTQLYWDIYLRPLLLAFGELRYDTLAGCLDGEDASQGCPHPSGLRAYAGGLMHVYLIVVNLLLINLLIAKFSLTVTVKDAQGFVTWRRYRYQLLHEFEAINTLPPPINALSILLDWLFRCLPIRNTGTARCSNAAADDGVELRTAVVKADNQAAAGGGVGSSDDRRGDAATAVFELVQAVALRNQRRDALSRERDPTSVFDE